MSTKGENDIVFWMSSTSRKPLVLVVPLFTNMVSLMIFVQLPSANKNMPISVRLRPGVLVGVTLFVNCGLNWE